MFLRQKVNLGGNEPFRSEKVLVLVLSQKRRSATWERVHRDIWKYQLGLLENIKTLKYCNIVSLPLYRDTYRIVRFLTIHTPSVSVCVCVYVGGGVRPEMCPRFLRYINPGLSLWSSDAGSWTGTGFWGQFGVSQVFLQSWSEVLKPLNVVHDRLLRLRRLDLWPEDRTLTVLWHSD